jgi:hypothetical protein
MFCVKVTPPVANCTSGRPPACSKDGEEKISCEDGATKGTDINLTAQRASPSLEKIVPRVTTLPRFEITLVAEAT